MAVNTMGGAVVCVAMCIHKVQVLCCVCCVGPTVICVVAMQQQLALSVLIIISNAMIANYSIQG